MYELLGICVVLSALLTLNACASFATAIAWQVFAPFTLRFSARTRADILFTMGIAAPALAAISVTLFLIPSYLTYEPRSTSEVVSKKLAALAIISLAGVAFAFWRAARSWFATRTLRKEWMAISERIYLPGTTIPTFRIAHRFPIIAVVGTLRPRLFIAADVLRSLNKDELAAAIAHERGHLAARDNFRRTLLRICRDTLFLVPFGRAVDRVWAETAECAADEFAAQCSPATALNLASALVTIAKMVPVGARADVPLAAYLVGVAENQGVKARIRRLIEIASTDVHKGKGNRGPVHRFPLVSLIGLALFAALVGSNAKVLIAVHALIERAVSLLC